MFEKFGTVSKKQDRVTSSYSRHLVQLVRNKQSNSLISETFGTVSKKQDRVHPHIRDIGSVSKKQAE